MTPAAALVRWLIAHDAERAAAQNRARVDLQTHKGRPPPKRMPRTAVMFNSLPADRQAEITEAIRVDMGPSQEAGRLYTEAKAGLDAAIRCARRAAVRT